MLANGPELRALCSWISRATSSLPVPVSPTNSTGAWLAATLAISRRRLWIAGLLPTSRALSVTDCNWARSRRRSSIPWATRSIKM